MNKSIAIIVQRYGSEINGGAELHCRLLAETLSKVHDVEVLTTAAIDYNTWKSELPEGETFVNGIKVHRFTCKERDRRLSRKSANALSNPIYLLKHLRFKSLLRKFSPKWKDGEIWLKAQGPYCEALIGYLEKNHQKYDVLIFMSSLYYPTAVGIRIAPEKSILIPTAHDERAIYFHPYKQVFNTPAYIIYNTLTEKEFVEKLFRNHSIPNCIAGIGIEPVNPTFRFPKDKYGITDDFIVYVGRITPDKVVDLFDDFSEYKKCYSSTLKLVLIGQASISIPAHPDIIHLGFVSDELKNSAIKSALLLVLPSKFESLSMVVLESLYFRTPVLVSRKCEVLVEHCKISGAGFTFNNRTDFNNALEFARNNKAELKEMGVLGEKYVSVNYNWDTVIQKFNKAFDSIKTAQLKQ